MNSKLNQHLDWEKLHCFLIVAQQGSLSAAARLLGLSQPTFSRQIQSLEKALQLQLFERSPQGLVLTEAGARLVESVKEMEAGSERFLRQASGLTGELEGDLRISANEIMGIFILPPALAAFRKKHPLVQIELVITNEASSLNKREADIALRMFRPRQSSLVARRLPDLALGFYAHRDYLFKHGTPQTREDLKQHILIGFDRDFERMMGELPGQVQVDRQDFALRSDQMLAQIQLLRSGAGIAATHQGLARHWPELQAVMEWMPLPSLECWLVCHSDTQYNAKVRSMTAFLAEWLTPDPYAHCLI